MAVLLFALLSIFPASFAQAQTTPSLVPIGLIKTTEERVTMITPVFTGREVEIASAAWEDKSKKLLANIVNSPPGTATLEFTPPLNLIGMGNTTAQVTLDLTIAWRYPVNLKTGKRPGGTSMTRVEVIVEIAKAPVLIGGTVEDEEPDPALVRDSVATTEGRLTTITADVAEDADSYRWEVLNGAALLTGPVTNNATATLVFTPPHDLAGSGEVTTKATLQLSVTAGGNTTTLNKKVVIAKVDNDQIKLLELGGITMSYDGSTFELPETTAGKLALDSDGAGSTSSVRYQWQRCVNCEVDNPLLIIWSDINENSTKSSYTAPLNFGDAFLRVAVAYTDGQGYQTTVNSMGVDYTGNNTPMIVTPMAETVIRVQEGRTTMIEVVVSDEDIGDALTLELIATDADQDNVTLPDSLEVGVSGSARRAQQELSIRGLKAGKTTLTLVVSDGAPSGGESSASLVVTVTANSTPTITGVGGAELADITLLPEAMATATVEVGDADDDDNVAGLRVVVRSSAPTVATAELVAANTAERSIRIRAVAAGTAMITVMASDGREVPGSSTSTAMFRVVVEANAAPTLTMVPASLRLQSDGSAEDITVTVSDSNIAEAGDRVTVTAVADPAGIITVSPPTIQVDADGDITLMLTPQGAGMTTVTITATDSRMSSAIAMVPVLVNQKPTVSDGGIADQVVTIETTFNRAILTGVFSDVNGHALTYTATGFPSTSNLALSSDGRLFTTTDAGVVGDPTQDPDSGVTVTVTADDRNGGMTTATFTLLFNAAPTGDVTINVDNAPTTLTVTSTVRDDNGISTDKTEYQWFLYKDGMFVPQASANAADYRLAERERTADTQYRVVVTFTDSIGTTWTATAQHTIQDVAPQIEPIAPVATTEGETVTLIAKATDANGDMLTYQWSVLGGGSITLPVGATSTLMFVVPTALVGADAEQTTLRLQLMVTGNGVATTTQATVIAIKENNGDITLEPVVRDRRMLTLPAVDAAKLAQDLDAAGSVADVRYQWQRCTSTDSDQCLPDGAGWMEISPEVTVNTYTVPIDSLNARFRVAVFYKDGQGYGTTVNSMPLKYEANNQPTYTVMPTGTISVQEGRQIVITVTVSDADTNDVLTLRLAAAEGQERVQLLSSADITVSTNNMESRMPQTFTIKGLQQGEAQLTLNVTDDHINMDVSQVRLAVMVTPNNTPTITETADIRLLPGVMTTATVTLGDADSDDRVADLRVLVRSSTPNVATAELVTANTAERNIRIGTVAAGMTVITMEASDGRELANSTAIETFTVTVEANTAPAIETAAQQVVQLGSTKAMTVTVRDENMDAGDRVTVVASSSDASIVAISPTTQTITDALASTLSFMLTPVAVGTTTLTVTATDSKGETTRAFVSVLVNRQPTVEGRIADRVVTIGTTFSEVIVTDDVFADADGNMLTYTATGFSTTSNLALSSDGRLFTTTDAGVMGDPTKNDTPPVTVTVTAHDGNEGTAKATFMLSFNAELTGMVSIDDSDAPNQLAADISEVMDANGINESLTTYQWWKHDGTAFVQISGETDRVYMLQQNEERNAGTQYRVDVSFTDTINQVVTLSARHTIANKTPVFVAPTTGAARMIRVQEGRTTMIEVIISEADTDDVLTLELQAIDAQDNVELLGTTSRRIDPNGSAQRARQEFRIKGLKAGKTTLTLVVQDDDTTNMAESSASLVVTVVPNNAPMITGLPEVGVTILPRATRMFPIQVTDADNDDKDYVENFVAIISVSGSGVNPSVEMSPTTGAARQLTVISGLNTGIATVRVTISDGRGIEGSSTVTAMFTVTVDANTAPTITAVPMQTLQVGGSTQAITVTVADDNIEDGDSVVVTAVSADTNIVGVSPARQTAVGSLMFVLEPGGAGRVDITFTATDSKEASNTTMVEVLVNRQPTVPGSIADQVVTIGTTLSRIIVTGVFHDGDGNALTYTVDGLPPDSNLDLSPDGRLFTTPANAEVVGSATTNTALAGTVTVAAHDGNEGTARTTFKLLFNAVPDGDVTINVDNAPAILIADISEVDDDNGIDTDRTAYQWWKYDDDTTAFAAIGNATGKAYTLQPDERTADTRYRVDVTFTDNIGTTATLSSAEHSIVNQAPVIAPIVSQTTTEGEVVVISATATDPNNDDLTYQWSVLEGDKDPSILTSEVVRRTSLTFTVPVDWVVGGAEVTQTTLTLQLSATDSGGRTATTRATVVVIKEDNDQITNFIDGNIVQVSRSTFTAPMVPFEDDADGEGMPENNVYQWQHCPAGVPCSDEDSSGWVNAPGASTQVTYKILGASGIQNGARFRVQVTYTDAQGYDDVTLLSNTVSYDSGNYQPQIIAPIGADRMISVQKDREKNINVKVRDNDVEDLLGVSLFPENNTPQQIVQILTENESAPTNNSTMREVVFTIKGLEERGVTTLTLQAFDGSTFQNSASDDVKLIITVTANTTPTITAAPADQTLQLERGAQDITVTVGDEGVELELGDIVTVTAISSSASIVEVSPTSQTQIGELSFRLRPVTAGMATVTIIATDSANTTARVTVSVLVNQKPTVAEPIDAQVVTIGSTALNRAILTGVFTDANGHELSYTATGFPSTSNLALSSDGNLITTPTNARVMGDATQSPVSARVVTVSAADGNGGITTTTFNLLFNAETAGPVSIDDSDAPNQLAADVSAATDANGINEGATTYQWLKYDGTGFATIGNATNRVYTLQPDERTAGTRYRVDVTFTDNIGVMATLSSAEHSIVNQAPVIAPIVSQTTTEGEVVVISATATDPNNDDLTYQWSVLAGDNSILNGVVRNRASLMFTVPVDWVDSAELAQTTLTLQLRATDPGSRTATTRATVVVVKTDNDQITNFVDGNIVQSGEDRSTLTAPLVPFANDADGAGTAAGNVYQWQRCPVDGANCSDGGSTDSSDWADIMTASTQVTYKILATSGIGDGDKLRVQVTYTDAQGYQAPLLSNVLTYSAANSQPQIIRPDRSARMISVQAGREKDINVQLRDGDTDDILTLVLSTDDTEQFVEIVTTSDRVSTNGNVVREATLKIKGLKVGAMSLKLIAADDSGSPANSTSVEIMLAVTVTANNPPTITGLPGPETSTRMLLETTRAFTMRVADADRDDRNRVENFVAITTVSNNNVVDSWEVSPATGAVRQLVIRSGAGIGITTITVMISDGREVAGSSTATAIFTVTVEANEAPEIEAPLHRTLQLGRTEAMTAVVRDENMGAGDRVIVVARSSSASIVEISPTTQTVAGELASTLSFTLTPVAAGTATLAITATDSKGETTRVMVSVLVNRQPTVVADIADQVVTIGTTLNRAILTGIFSDADGNTLTYTATGLPSTSNLALSPDGNLFTTTDAGVVGDATQGLASAKVVTVSADDGKGGATETTFKLLFNAETTGAVSIIVNDGLTQLTAVTDDVKDANGISEMTYRWSKYDGTTDTFVEIENVTGSVYMLQLDERRAGTRYRVAVTFVDNIGTTTTLLAEHPIANQAPEIILSGQSFQAPEGALIIITAQGDDPNNDDLSYAWSIAGGDQDPSILRNATTDRTILVFRVPPAWNAPDANRTTLAVAIVVQDGTTTSMALVPVTINTRENGPVATPMIVQRGRVLTAQVDFSSDPDGAADTPMPTYQWQICSTTCHQEAQWPVASTGTKASYRIPEEYAVEGNQFRVLVTYTDRQGYSNTILSETLTYKAAMRVRLRLFLEGALQ